MSSGLLLISAHYTQSKADGHTHALSLQQVPEVSRRETEIGMLLS